MQNFTFLFTSIIKLVGVIGFVYVLLWVLGNANKWVKIFGIFLLWLVMQIALSYPLSFNDNSPLLNNFDYGLLVTSVTMAMVALGLNLIYGFNGQFSLGQYGFYGIGAYAAADIVWRWINGDARGLLVVGLGTIFGGLIIWGIQSLLRRIRGVPVLSAFTMYIIGSIIAGAAAVFIGNQLNPFIVLHTREGTHLKNFFTLHITQTVLVIANVVLIGLLLAILVFASAYIIRKIIRIERIPRVGRYAIIATAILLAAGIMVLLGGLGNQVLLESAGTSLDLMTTGVFLLAILFAGVFAAEISFLFGLPVLTLGSDYFGIATLGFTIVANTLMVNSDTILPFPEMKGGRGMIGIPKLVTADTWIWPLLFLILVIVIMRNVIQSSTGRAILSVREDETAAKAMGIDVASNKLLTFVIGSFFAGLAGGVYAFYIGFLSPATFNFLTGFNPLIIVVFGGLGSMTGTLTAAFGWTFFLEGLLRNLLAQMGTEAPTWRFVLYPITLLLMMLIRPQGMLGTVEWGFLKNRVFAARKSSKTEPAATAAVEE
jgi:branched-chain amino acid transport system permease protein